MPDTFQALGVLLIALLPGALYIWGFEREAGRWGISATDRLLRFVGASALLHAVSLPLTWHFWKSEIRTGNLATGRSDWFSIWMSALVYVATPVALGSVAGVGARREWPWIRLLAGRHPAPRAWDHLFAAERPAWIRMKMKSGAWIGGVFADIGTSSSYAAGYPDDQDLYIAALAVLDPVTGAFITEHGQPVTGRSGLLVRWGEIEYLEFTPVDPHAPKEAS